MAHRNSATQPLFPWLKLLHAPGIGPVRGRALLQHFGGMDGLSAATAGQLAEYGLPAAAISVWQRRDIAPRLQQELHWLTQDQHHLLHLEDSRYPALLREISNPPLALYVVGDTAVLEAVNLAIVGSRNPTPSGAQTTLDFARHLSQSGMSICSGLAHGVDGSAHRGALAVSGLTVAVMGTGLDQVYPRVHRDLAVQIAKRGALVSEFPLGTAPRPQNFPRRNRIISGLSVGTLVTEAALRSGSLLTARHALEQGREVFAIPGSIHSPLSRGCHALIRQGAKLIEVADDILCELGPLVGAVLNTVAGPSHDSQEKNPLPASTGNAMQEKLLSCLDYTPSSLDNLVARSQFSPQLVVATLTVLEMQGQVESLQGGGYVLSSAALPR